MNLGLALIPEGRLAFLLCLILLVLSDFIELLRPLHVVRVGPESRINVFIVSRLHLRGNLLRFLLHF